MAPLSPCQIIGIVRLLDVAGSVIDGFGKGVAGHELEFLGELAVHGQCCTIIARAGFCLKLIDGVIRRVEALWGKNQAAKLLRCGIRNPKAGSVLRGEKDRGCEVAVDGAS